MAERRWSDLSFDYFYSNTLLCFDSGPSNANTEGWGSVSIFGLINLWWFGILRFQRALSPPPFYIKTNLSPFPWTNFCVRPCMRACHLRLQWIDHYAMVIQGWHVLAQPILAKHTWYNMVKVKYFFSESYAIYVERK